MLQHVPNLLTGLRLILAAVFFIMLGYYQHDVSGWHGNVLWLNIAFVIYAIALFTDFLDGYLARKWKVESAFGRVVDPFVDKVLVLGSFIFFAGKNFTIPLNIDDPSLTPTNVLTITGVVPWMVVVILARELLVTSLRGLAESGGQSFGAMFSGKLKMVFQSVTILVVLAYVNYHVWLESQDRTLGVGVRWFRDVAIWSTLVITVWSGLLYIQKAMALYRAAGGKSMAPVPTEGIEVR